MSRIAPHRLPSPRRQRGMFTLLITLVIIVAIGVLTYTMTNTTTIENRTTGSEIRSKQAFHAAQSGLDYALQLFMDNDIETLNSSCFEMPVDDTQDTSAQATFQLRFGSASDVAQPQCPYPPLGLQTAVVVRSIGRALSSDNDRDVPEVRVLEVTIDLHREWDLSGFGGGSAGAPVSPAAIVAKGGVTIGGNGNAAPCLSVPQCEVLARPGNQSQDIRNVDDKLIIAGGGIAGGQTGNPKARIQEKHKDANNAAIAAMSNDQFFEHIFGVDRDTFRGSAARVSGGNLPSVNLNPAIWVEGNLTLQGDVLGTPSNPVTLVVEGNLTITGNAIIWGVVYTAGSQFSAGNSKIFGSLVAENNITALTGTSSVFHNESLATIQVGSGSDGGESSASVVTVRAYFDTGSWREVPAREAFADALPLSPGG